MNKKLIAASLCAFGMTNTAIADQVFNDDLIVRNDACIGLDCMDGEVFGSPHYELKIKASAVKLRFEDTSGSDHNWELVTNEDSTDGFHIEDATDDTRPFTIEGGTPNNALYVADDGNIGVGTSLPQEVLHLASPFPQIRFEDNAGTPYLWDIGGNNFSFFVQDETAQTFPLIIRDAAPDSSILVASNGDVGMGTGFPTAALHVRRTDGTAGVTVQNTSASPSAVREMFKMTNNGGSFFTLENSQAGTTWFFVHENASPNRFIITDGVNDGPEMTVTADGDLTIEGELTTAGSCSVGCDRVFEADYALPTIAEHNAKMWENGYLPNVGPTPEDGPFNVTDKMGRMLNELEHAHIFIGQQQEQIEALIAQQSALMARLEMLETQK